MHCFYCVNFYLPSAAKLLHFRALHHETHCSGLLRDTQIQQLQSSTLCHVEFKGTRSRRQDDYFHRVKSSHEIHRSFYFHSEQNRPDTKHSPCSAHAPAWPHPCTVWESKHAQLPAAGCTQPEQSCNREATSRHVHTETGKRNTGGPA